ncbi:DUF2169 domain-containing protein [uncultured Roseibium sp.]|uniref:DUF2169 family type VI secretion system accessory protein n=1 Tax=uncultured Roseibium sp. TaxID=1936171 RepID=UPI00260E5370|nr:DUF2169 domain-containing protein [uncultured Roseibium sp.]
MPSIIKSSRASLSMNIEAIENGALSTVTMFLLCDLESPHRLLTEQALWPMVTEQLPKGAIFDKGQLKPHGEVMVAGSALSPTDDPVEAVRVSIHCAGIAKSLAVFGDRYWMLTDRGIEMSRPAPFLKMPIGDQTSFGGPKHQLNPKGKGDMARQLLDSGFDAPLPNVELANAPIRSIDEAPAPANFGPLPPDSKARMKLAGTYDQHWMKCRAPLKPEDFNPKFHCDAPDDQQIETYFSGGEPFSITGMTRGETTLQGQLPDLRGRCFYKMAKTGELREAKMVCDTVTFFPNVRKATLAFRGLIRSEDSTGDDITHIMLAVESKNDVERPREYYAEVFRKRTDPEIAHLHLLSDFQLLPDRNPDELSEKRKAMLERAQADRIKFLQNADWGTRKAVENAGLSPDVVPPPDLTSMDDIPLVGTPTKEDITNGDFDVAELIEQAEEARRAVEERMNRELATAELQRRKLVEALPSSLAPETVQRPMASDEVVNAYPDIELPKDLLEGLEGIVPAMSGTRNALAEDIARYGHSPDAEQQGRIDRALEILDGEIGFAAPDTEDSFAKAKARALKLPEGSLIADARSGLDSVDLSFLDQVDGVDEALTEQLSDFGGLKIDVPDLPDLQDVASLKLSSDALLPSKDADAKATDAIGERIDGSKDRLREIAGHIVSDASTDPIADIIAFGEEKLVPPLDDDISGLSPKEKANHQLDKGRQALDAAEQRLEEELPEARRLSPEPIFPIEDLAPGVPERLGAFVVEQIQKGHDFKGADLAGAVLKKVDFAGQDLSGTLFEKADLTGANFSGCNLTNAVFSGAILDDADLSGADLTSANLSHASLARTKLTGATLAELDILESSLENADASGASLQNVQFITCQLDGMNLGSANLKNVTILQSSGPRLCLNDAKINGFISIQTSLTALQATHADLDRLILADSDLSGANFNQSQLDNSAVVGASSLKGSTFIKLRAFNTFFNGLTLAESCFVGSACTSCYFHQCDLTSCDFRVSLLNTTLFGGSDLKYSDFFGASLYAASLDKCDLRRCSFRASNLYAANLRDALIASADLTDANLGLTLMGQARHG